jgi:DNA repair protein RadC
VSRHIVLNSAPEARTEKTQTWHHPGGKLVELGAHTLKQDELLAIVIGSGVAGRPALAIANSILDEYVGLYGIYRTATVDDLAKIAGLGSRKAGRILAAIELGRRLHKLTKLPQAPAQTENDLFSSGQPISQLEPQPNGPSDADLLAEIIGSGIRGRPPKIIAKDLLAKFGSFLGLFGQDMGEFLSIKGLNSVKVIRIAAAMEIAKRISHAMS